jgi:hypothetical protein
MAKLIGTAPNQVPTNGDLGSMAYQDYDVIAPQLIAGRRNLIINGAMQVAQRGTQVTGVTTSDYYTCDRFKWIVSNLGTWTVDQSTDAPNGFSNSFKLTATTADASPSSLDYAVLAQYIESQNLQHLAFGTSDAKQLTMSFWVKSNKTGNATFEIIQPDNNGRHASFSYSINVADTWEHKTIAIPTDVSGLINNDNGAGLEIDWWINSGSNFTGGSPQETWTTRVNANRNPSNIGVGGSTSDYFAITGVQLEVGSVATPFEHRSYGEELALCQRYLYKAGYNASTNGTAFGSGTAYASTSMIAYIQFPTEMRATPSVSSSGAFDFRTGIASNVTSGFTINQGSPSSTSITATIDSTTQGQGGVVRTDTAGSYVLFDAEL